ncbi:MAG TPA: hypothetical protein VE035_13460 [Puia sp.]|nr:hypothetical protein [Puia sp.]
MKVMPLLSFVLLIVVSCHSSGKKSPGKPIAADTAKMYPDSTKADLNPDIHPRHDTAVILKTHLTDTSYLAGNFILFLRPNEARYAELENDPDGGAGDADSDFGVGISNTIDSLRKNARYATVKALTSTKRYIFIKDCRNGPLVIDRDSVNYGTILSGKGKPISTTYNSVHSGNYLGEIDDYFSLH